VAGSLSGNDNPSYFIDGSQSYTTDLRFLTPSGIYSLGDDILIQLTFSSPVLIVGDAPSIELAVGRFRNQQAYYTSGNNSNVLIFTYSPEPGDYTIQLDYSVNRAKMSSAVDSFLYNGGYIYTASDSPTLEAFIYFNPINGILSGTTEVLSFDGVASYVDLNIKRRGPDYLLRFITRPTSAGRILTLTQTIFVSFSNEVDVMPSRGLKKELIGSAVAIDGDLAILGSLSSL
jgi:hypothetical protein